MRINTNLTAMNTYTQYTKNSAKIASSVAKLSSGYAINTAADNAAGLAISEKMRAQIRGLGKASSNAQDAISLVQTAEGALSSSTEILQRMRELSVQSSSDTNENAIDRTALQDEFSQLQNELNDIAKNTTFNKKNLLDGSLATVSKNLGATTLANSGMTVQLGNAATGNYKFNVSTQLTSAAVAGKKPSTPELVTDGAGTYFGGTNSIALGTNAAASDLLNGNYTLSASYSDPTNDNGDGQITVTATGDNGQSFQSKVSAASLTALGTSKTLSLNFNSQADDAFNITLNLSSNITGSENNYDTLASNVSKLSVSVSGGVTAKDAEYGVYANLTGADSIKLESGQTSVTFGNGVKVNFDTLTATSVDTSNKANITDATAVANPTGASLAASLGTLGGQAIAATGTSLTITDAGGKIGQGNYSITSDASGVMTLTDNAGTKFTAAAQSTAIAAAPQTLNYQFKDASGNNAFTGALTLAAGGAFTSVAPATFASAVTGTRGYALGSLVTAGTSATMSNFKFADDSTISNADFAITAADDGTTTTFTATDAAGHKYAASTTNAAMKSGTASGVVTNSLTFTGTGTDKATGFTVDLTTTNTGATGTTFTNNATVLSGMTVATAGHNYEKVFGASTTDLSASTASSFSIEATKNAGLTFQVGANEGDSMVINVEKMDATYLGVASASVATRSAASNAIKSVDSAINEVSQQRANLGAIQNRLEYKISNLNTSSENLTSAESQIRDVDMAKEMTNFTNANILNQAATAMLAQANSLPQSVLSLIGK